MADGNPAAAHTPPDLDAGQVVRLWPPAEAAAFRDGLARLASGVAVVACWSNGRPRGLLVSSLTGLSTEPPRILFCVRKAAPPHQALIGADAVSLSILSDGHRHEAERFSRSELAEQRFGPKWRLDPRSAAKLPDALVSLAGPVHCRIDAGTHTVFILDVSVATAQPGAPLVYFERAYEALARG